MCEMCGDARKSVLEEIVKRTELDPAIVEKVLLTLEDMTREMDEAQNANQMERLRDAVLAAVGPNAVVSMVEVTPDGDVISRDGEPVPMAAHPAEPVQERLPGLYL